MIDEVEVEHRFSLLEQDQKSVHRRLDNLEKLVESVHTIATETKAMRRDMNDITDRVDEIERRPQKRYETLVTAIITALVGAIVGYILNGAF